MGNRSGCPRTDRPRTPPGQGHGAGASFGPRIAGPSITYTERLAGAGIAPSVGSVGDNYDTALAETINGLFKAEVIDREGTWRSIDAVGYATLVRHCARTMYRWLTFGGFNYRRLLEPIRNIPPAAAEANVDAAPETEAMAASLTSIGPGQTRRSSAGRST